MKIVNHQFLNESFYTPNWPLKYLFLGTFNPEGGEKVGYYYGRKKNQFWPLLREVFNAQFNLNNAKDFFSEIQHHGIGCMDMIQSVEVPEEKIEYILGKGYNDSKIINGYTRRIYNTNNILAQINQNPEIRVFSTWGNGQNLSEWKREVGKVKGLVNLVSPSLAARVPLGTEKFPFMLNDWQSKINKSK